MTVDPQKDTLLAEVDVHSRHIYTRWT